MIKNKIKAIEIGFLIVCILPTVSQALDKEDILKFENNVKPIMEKIALSSLENKRLAELRDTLLPKLMNGEIDLDNIEI